MTQATKLADGEEIATTERLTVRVLQGEPPTGRGEGKVRRQLWLVPVALVALAGLLFAANARHEANQRGGEDARKVVAGHVEQLLSYDYREIDEDLESEGDWLTGSFADEYASLVTDEIAPAAEKAQVVTDARVSASGVASTGHHEVELLLFVNVTTRSTELDEPRVSGSRLSVRAEYVDGEWRISSLDPV